MLSNELFSMYRPDDDVLTDLKINIFIVMVVT